MTVTKAWVIKLQNNSLHVIKANFKPANPSYIEVVPAITDEITGELERGEWLQIENIEIEPGVFEKRATVNATLKEQILDDEATARADKEAADAADIQQLKDFKKDVKKIKSADLNTAPGIREAILRIQKLLVRLEEKVTNIEGV